MNRCILSIDWEDFGQLYAKYHYGKVTAPNPAIERQTDIILDILEKGNAKATFFVLGMLASYRPDLVKKIAGAGHEIALHGQNHEAMFTLSREKAYEDLATSKKIVEDIIGERVYGYRAPFFSVDERNLYVLDILAELGMEYDSSIFPIRMSRYGIAGFDTRDLQYQLPSGRTIVELPLTVGTYFGKKLPISGGGYMRLMPGGLVNKVFSDLEKQGKDAMIYMHPYEFDTASIDVSSNYPEDAKYSKLKVAALNLKWNVQRNSIREKISNLLKQYTFQTCKEKVNYVKNNGDSPVVLGR
jgi:polysaccharide deacetylase family protein (PEP-CTERM system associated)